MKHLKVKDLDPVLQNVARRAVCKNMIAKDDDYAENLLAHVDWSKCTDEERLKYAELMYPVGTKFIPVVPNTHNDKEGCITDIFSDGELFQVFNEGIASGKNWVYHLGENKWAKILSRPDEKEETKEPEFQPGEIVEWRTSKTGEPEWSKAEYHGKNRFGLYVISENTVACCVENIRKIHPDPEKEIALAAVNYCDQMDEFYKGRDRDIQIAITAIRKYKALKTEIK